MIPGKRNDKIIQFNINTLIRKCTVFLLFDLQISAVAVAAYPRDADTCSPELLTLLFLAAVTEHHPFAG